VVNNLRLDGDGPRLVATVCEACEARYLGNRMACARCGGTAFTEREAATRGTVGSFTILHRGPASVPRPFVSALVDLEDGLTVKANLIGCRPDPAEVRLNMPVELRTFEAGTDGDGVTAIAFAFAPVDPPREEAADADR
jgi:uncharacterized OB-fold protein